MASRIITNIEITFAEVDHTMESAIVRSYADLDDLNRAFRNIRDDQNHDAYCKTDVRFTWSDGEVETVKFDIFGKKAMGQDANFEAIVGRWIKHAAEAVDAPKQGRSVTGYASKAEAEENLAGLREFFAAAGEYKAEVAAAPESDADKIIAELRAQLAESQENLAAEERSSGALQEQLDEQAEVTNQFLEMREQLKALRGLMDAMNLDA